MRPFSNRVDYYAIIIDSAMRELAEDPTSTLFTQVTANISGGHYYWDTGADELFNRPNNLDEGLLALELRTVLETAIRNQLREVCELAQHSETDLSDFGFPMNFGLLLESVVRMAPQDPVLALQVKIAMAQVTRSVDDRALADFLGCYCLSDHEYGEQYCAMF